MRVTLIFRVLPELCWQLWYITTTAGVYPAVVVIYQSCQHSSGRTLKINVTRIKWRKNFVESNRGSYLSNRYSFSIPVKDPLKGTLIKTLSLIHISEPTRRTPISYA